jgi:serine/threonine protein kinase
MHDQGEVHGNLRAVRFHARGHPLIDSLPGFQSNIMIDNDGHARLTDFNSLRMISEEQSAATTAAESGNARWMSPELLVPDQFNLKESCPTKASDCYALGMVIYEILSGKIPFYEDSTYAAVLKILEGKRPTRPQESKGGRFTDGIWEMLGRCWRHQPTHRISAKSVPLYLVNLPQDSYGDVMMMDVDDQLDDTSEEDEYVSPFSFPSQLDLFGIGPPITSGDERHPNSPEER